MLTRRSLRHHGMAAAATAIFMLIPASLASATVDHSFASPDLDVEEDVPAFAASMPTVGTFDVTFADVAESGQGTVVALPATCTVTVDNPFDGTRDPNTKRMSGRFTPTATTSCGSTAVSLYTVVVERKSVSVTTTDVKSAPPASCQVGATPCVQAMSTTTYDCSPCNPASWRARSTHRLTLPSNRYFVDYPPTCEKITATIVECVLTTGRLTIK